MNRLLAKSYDRAKHHSAPPAYALLTQHTVDVVEACGSIVDAVGQATLENLGLDGRGVDELRLQLRVNGWIQDLGKANSHFQTMLAAEPQLRQLLRHEIISGLLVWHVPQLRAWLAGLPYSIVPAVWGAMGHHRKFDERTRAEQVANVEAFVAHADFRSILEAMAEDLGLSSPPEFSRNLILGRPSGGICDLRLPAALDDLTEEFEDLEPAFEASDSRRRLAIVKSFGIAADVVASAIGNRSQSRGAFSIRDFVSESLVGTGLRAADLTALINKWAWDHTDCGMAPRDESSLPPRFTFREFQNHVAESESSLTLARAGCGSGKSLAAYLWARRWCRKNETSGRSNFRLFVCLPTTGTATEHFKDYALESGIASSLSHSRANIDLGAIAETVPQEDAENQDDSAAVAARSLLAAERDKIDALKLWSTPLVVGTADTVLGLMVNGRRSIYSFPAIMCGAIVFDEIHAFDDRMFGHLLVFLRNFPALPILLMTASLPEHRRRAIELVRQDLKVVPGPLGFEELERYVVTESRDERARWCEVEKCVAEGGKVLWVRNRVEWANEIYRECRTRFPAAWVNVYHSRLRYIDRSRRHRLVIDHFKESGRAAILVATQVAEMSLDLSADLLVTDIAPIPSLIQRLGRLNRRSTPDHRDPPAASLVCQLPENTWGVAKPYEESDLEAAWEWARGLQMLGRPLSQRDLSDGFARFCQSSEYDIGSAEERAWFFGKPGKTGIWRTRPGFIRDEGFTVAVVLENDLQNCDERDRYGNPTRDWLRKFEVSIPFKDPLLGWRRVGSLPVAPADSVEYDYDSNTHEGTGAKWREP